MSNQLLLAKKEVTPGTAVALTAADAIWAMNVQFKSLGTRIVLEPAKVSMAANPGLITGEHSEVTFDVQLSASGAVATAPAWGKLIKASGYGETITPVTSVAYAILSDPDTSDSLTMVFRNKGRLHKMVYCRGKIDLKATAGQVPMLSFTFRGILVPLIASAYPAPGDGTFATWTDTRPIASGRTTFSLGGVPLVLRDLSVTGADNVKFIDLPGQKGVFLRGDRALSGNFKANVPDIDTYNPESKWIAGAKDVFSLVHNTVAGSIVTINGRVQLDAPSWSDEDGFDVFTSQAFLVGSDIASNDDFSILLT